MSSHHLGAAPRDASIDNAKAIGMFLVFYGHIWFKGFFPSAALFEQNKFIYSFHMPLFFLLSGMVYRQASERFGRVVAAKFFSRMGPVLLFCILLLAAKLSILLVKGKPSLIAGEFIEFGRIVSGLPYSTITWFLICLMVVELIYFLILDRVRRPGRAFVAAAVCTGAMLFALRDVAFLEYLTGLKKNFWFLHEALVAIGFFALGHWLSASGGVAAMHAMAWPLRFVAGLALIFLAWLTVDLNFQAVYMVESQHGDPVWFVVTALAGSLGVILLCSCVGQSALLGYVGRHTLVLLGMNGLFRDIIDPTLVKRLPIELLQTHLSAFVICFVVTIISMALCTPAIPFYQRWYGRYWDRPLRAVFRMAAGQNAPPAQIDRRHVAAGNDVHNGGPTEEKTRAAAGSNLDDRML
jgi:fucose 4-O-acetylase-like acetyltransferase